MGWYKTEMKCENLKKKWDIKILRFQYTFINTILYSLHKHRLTKYHWAYYKEWGDTKGNNTCIFRRGTCLFFTVISLVFNGNHGCVL